MDYPDTFSSPEIGLLSDDEKSLGQLTTRRMRTRRLPVRTRVLLFAVIAVGVVLLPFGLLYAFEGIESGEGGLIVDRPPVLGNTTSTVVRPVQDPQGATPIAITSTSTIPIATTSVTQSTTPSSSPPLRQDLPERELTPYVNPLIGTEGLGHSFAGATIPFGMAKPVADSSTPWQNQAGFIHDNSQIKGLSQLHDDGTGGNPSFGNFPLWMSTCGAQTWDSCPVDWNSRMGHRVGEPRARVGQFGIDISTGFRVDMTSTRRTNLFRIEAVEGVEVPILSVGLMDLSGSTVEAFSEIRDGFQVVGNGTFSPSFGEGKYSLHFCMDVQNSHSRVRDHGIIRGEDVFINQSSVMLNDVNFFQQGSMASRDAAVMLRFNPLAAGEHIIVRMGMSFISPDQACSNAAEEIPTFDFDAVSRSSISQFESLLNRIRVDTTDVPEDTVSLFYSSLYRTFISPQNYTGENPLWKSAEPTFDSYYCIWDTFRFTHPLYNILVPDAQSQFIRSLLDIYRHEGWLPECRMSFCKGITQSGSNADTLLTDAYIKGIQNVPWEEALLAIRKDAEVEPPNWGVEGRGNIADYDRLGYVPVDADYSHSRADISHRTVSRTIEYSHNDFSIALFARHIRDRPLYETYILRSSRWRNLWMSSATERRTQHTGFFQSRYANGTWKHDPRLVGLPGKDGEFYEESAWSYSWFVPHDYAAVVELVGGRERFVERLDVFFEEGFANVGNEPGLLQAVLYHYAGRPDKSVMRTRKLIGPVFNTGAHGLPGNDDAGSLGAYVVWLMSGLVPIAGQSVYLILPPYFPEVQWTVPNSRIITHNFGEGNTFIQNVTVDGIPWSKNWISHDFFSKGQTMEITLGMEPSEWGTGEADVPPSLSTGGFEFDGL